MKLRKLKTFLVLIALTTLFISTRPVMAEYVPPNSPCYEEEGYSSIGYRTILPGQTYRFLWYPRNRSIYNYLIVKPTGGFLKVTPYRYDGYQTYTWGPYYYLSGTVYNLQLTTRSPSDYFEVYMKNVSGMVSRLAIRTYCGGLR